MSRYQIRLSIRACKAVAGTAAALILSAAQLVKAETAFADGEVLITDTPVFCLEPAMTHCQVGAGVRKAVKVGEVSGLLFDVLIVEIQKADGTRVRLFSPPDGWVGADVEAWTPDQCAESLNQYDKSQADLAAEAKVDAGAWGRIFGISGVYREALDHNAERRAAVVERCAAHVRIFGGTK